MPRSVRPLRLGARHIASVVLGAGSLVFTGHQLWVARSAGLPPAPIPTFDVADYVVRAHAWAAVWRSPSLESFWTLATEVDPHPALHPALLGLVLAIGDHAPAVEGAWALALAAVGLGMVAVLSGLVDGKAGIAAGCVAGAVLSAGLLWESMVTAPMTEPLAWVLVAGAVAAFLLAGDRAWSLLVAGALAVAAGATRFNLLPTLLVGLIFATAFERHRSWSARLARCAALVLPCVVVVGALAVLSPDYLAGLRRFFTNVDSSIPPLSLANLQWFFGAWVRQVFGTVPVSLAAAAVVIASLFARTRPGANAAADLPLFTVALVGLGSLLAHPFKLDRNLFVFVPLVYLLVILPLARIAIGTIARWVFCLGGIVALVGFERATEGLTTERYYSDDRHVQHALEAVADAAEHADTVVLVGAHKDLSVAVVTYWLRRDGYAGTIVEQPAYPPACNTDRGEALEACHPTMVATYAGSPRVVVVTVADSGAKSRGRHKWASDAWDEVEAYLVPRGYRGAEVAVRAAGLRLRVYR